MKAATSRSRGLQLFVAWYVYIVRSDRVNKLYTGITVDVARRVREHNAGPRGAKATRAGRPWTLVHTETFETHREAAQREWAIKGMTRAQKDALIRRVP